MSDSSGPRPAVVEWIALFVGLFLMLRQAWILDDAFIYFRYADNLLFLGRGLVFNQGEWVEGYSSPLWMLLLTALRTLRLDWWLLVRLLAVSTWVVAWLGIVRVRWLLAPSGTRVWNLPLLYFATSYPILSYWSSGLETPLVQLGAVAAMLLILEPHRRCWQFAIATLPLVRHEFALPWLVLFAWCWWRARRFPRWMFGASAGLVASWMLLRVLLYAELLPNTFYLKDGAEWAQGWLYFSQFAKTQGLLFLLGAAAVAMVWLRTRGQPLRDLAARAAAVACCISAALYAVRVGGDMLYYRFFAFAFPLLLLSFSGLFPQLEPTLPAGVRRLWMPLLSVATVLASLLAVPPQLDRNPHLGLANVDEKRPVVIDGVNDANSHRRHDDLRFSPWSLDAPLAQLDAYQDYRTEHPDGAHARIEMEGWCYDSYIHFDARVVHRWGLTDPMLARIQLPWDRPGHRRGLVAHAEQLWNIRREIEAGKRPAGLRTMYEDGYRVPTWVRQNLDAMDVLEARMSNRHRLVENLRLAFRFVPRYPARRRGNETT